ncbi:MAG: aldo/keto reductase [Alphaproteobacteria bacterium]|nr:aldo/keto reductase [Alphaproteobacteria bacterium]
MSIDPAQTRLLGRSPVAVSRLGIGTGPYGNLMTAARDDALHATTQAALGAGLGYFDTSPFYGHGLSEHRLGETLRGVDRDRYVLSTKVGRLLKPRPRGRGDDGLFAAPLPFDVVYDYSFDGTLRSLEDSIQRLGVARIDIALIHDVNRRWQGDLIEQRYAEAMAGAFPALARLRSEGVIGAIGVGVNDVDILRRFAADGDFDCFMLAGRYTLLDATALDLLLPECVRRGIAILLAAPYNSGILATGAKPGATFWYTEAPPEIMARVARIEAIGRRHHVPLTAAALQFPLGHPAVASVVAGFRSPPEVAAALAALRHPIPAAFWQDLRQDGLIPADAPLPA